MDITKQCNKCKETKDISYFQKDPRTKDGYKGYCKSCRKTYIEGWHKRNPEYGKEYLNKNKEKRKINQDRWEAENKHRRRHLTALRRARLAQATPKWLTRSDLLDIEFIYAYCSYISKLMNIEHHVDHIIPLKGKDVCGLHVPWNLQVLDKISNLSKSNNI